GPWREDNHDAVSWWHEQLVDGKRLVAVGGSDAHNPQQVHVKHGMPTNWVYSKALTCPEILRTIDKGHVVLSYAPEGPFINMTCGESMVGDVCKESNQKVELTGNDVQSSDIV